MSSEKKSRGAPRTVYLIKRAESAIRSGLEACLQPLAITPAQYVTLSLLDELGDQSSAELARKAGITPQSMSETIVTLIKKGLIDRTESPEHRRILMTSLTDAGAALLGQCDVKVDALEAQALANVPPADLRILRASLRKIAGARPPAS